MMPEHATVPRLPTGRLRGFTLIELMITVVVLAILGAIAIPIYLHQVREARRTEARNALLELASREERYFATNNIYTRNASYLGYGNNSWPVVVGDGYYELPQPNVNNSNGNNPPTFTLTATTVTTSDQYNDTSCRSFSVTNTGQESSTNSSNSDSTTTCWPDATH